VTVTVTGGEGQLLLVSRNGQPAELPVPITADPFTHTFTATRSGDEGPLGTFWRVDTQVLDPTPVLTTIGNPVFLAGPGAAPDAAPAPAPPPSSVGAARAAALPATGAGPAVLPPLLALAAALALRGRVSPSRWQRGHDAPAARRGADRRRGAARRGMRPS
jgi:hypothetical protein